MNGKIIIKKPRICGCVIKIDNELKNINRKKFELPFGLHKINVGIKYYDTSDIGFDNRHSQWSDVEWAWKNDKEIVIDESITIIKIKRKWHLFKHITVEASMKRIK